MEKTFLNRKYKSECWLSFLDSYLTEKMALGSPQEA